MVRPS